jgi:hypothetical protein
MAVVICLSFGSAAKGPNGVALVQSGTDVPVARRREGSRREF